MEANVLHKTTLGDSILNKHADYISTSTPILSNITIEDHDEDRDNSSEDQQFRGDKQDQSENGCAEWDVEQDEKEADSAATLPLEDNISTLPLHIQGDDEEESDLLVGEGLEELPVKVEIIESSDETEAQVIVTEEDENEDTNTKTDGEDASCQDSDCLMELPVKTELVESDEAEDNIDLGEDDDAMNPDIKVELLEESYEDRINELLRVVNRRQFDQQDGSDENDKSNLSDADTTKAHFLIRGRPKRNHKRSLTCENCSAMFKYQSTYDYHIKSQCGTKMIAETNQLVKKAKNQSFTCNVCHKEMCSRTSLMVHMRIHNGERPFVCDICSRAFTQKAHLKDHMKIHTSGKNPKPLIFTCSECGELFDEKKFLQSHMQVHFGDKIFDCNVCHKRFRTRSNLSNHKIIHTDKRNFPCTICGKGFIRKPNLDDHMRVHTREKPFSCEICGKGFAEKGRRNTHVKRHTGELTQICSICNKKFACSYDLRIHQRQHTGEKPFSCNICGRMFNRKAIMETHMTIHTGRKDFVCTQCGEAFNRKSKLDVHLTTHTGEKFYCEICHRVFKCKAYLVPHIRTHFGQARKRRASKGSKCLLCSKKFRSSQLLEAHLTKAHTTIFNSNPQTSFVKVESVE